MMMLSVLVTPPPSMSVPGSVPYRASTAKTTDTVRAPRAVTCVALRGPHRKGKPCLLGLHFTLPPDGTNRRLDPQVMHHAHVREILLFQLITDLLRAYGIPPFRTYWTTTKHLKRTYKRRSVYGLGYHNYEVSRLRVAHFKIELHKQRNAGTRQQTQHTQTLGDGVYQKATFSQFIAGSHKASLILRVFLPQGVTPHARRYYVH